MAVNLSPIGGVAGQFFTNNGTPLSGGKIYTYAAGSSTPAATYTSASGSTAHTNPIVLDSGGRVPTGEIWLTDGLQYKFVIKTSADVLIGTYDNIVGINSNFVNYTNQQDIQTATAGQTLFTLPFSYAPGTNSLSVFVDGVNQYGPGAQYAYVETSSTEVTFTNGLHVGAEVKFTTSQLNSSAGGDASQVSYTPPFTDSVTTNVAAKLAQTVSVKDFGAVGDGATDDTAAIQAALDAAGDTQTGSGGFQTIAPRGAVVFIPAGTYRTTGTLIIPNNIHLVGTGYGSQFKFDPSAPNSDFAIAKNYITGGTASQQSGISKNFEKFLVFVALNGGTATGRNGSPVNTVNTNARHCFNISNSLQVTFNNVMVLGFYYGTAFWIYDANVLFSFYNTINQCYVRDCKKGASVNSATNINNTYFGHSSNYPIAADMPAHDYAVELLGGGSSLHGGSIECYASVALIKDGVRGASITGNYFEAFSNTPAAIDSSSDTATNRQSFHGGNYYGFTNNKVINPLLTRTGSGNFSLGLTLGNGECQELELEADPTRQSPSFREGLPGLTHFPAGGTIATSTDSFIDQTSVELVRGAGTAAANNTITYPCKLRGGKNVVANVWFTCLVKLEGGEDDFLIRISSPNNAHFEKVIDYGNGWAMYATYTTPVADQSFSFQVTQNAGSTDTSKKVKVTALRAYTNGFSPVPAAYKFPEYRTAAPTTGTWVRGDIVWNSQPSAGGAPGWVCTTGGAASVFVFKAMANLAV